MRKFVILQSGFKTAEHGNLALPPTEDVSNTINSVLQGTSIKQTINGYFQREVTDIYLQYSKDSRIITMFDFREYLLRVAITVFNEVNFKSWIELQNSNPHYTSTHKEFIIDTLTYLCTGVRNFNVETWPMLLGIKIANERDTKTVVNLNKYFSDHTLRMSPISDVPEESKGSYINFHTPDFIPINDGLVDVISRWTSHRDGYKDLIYSLYAIFGDRNQNA